MEEARNSSEKCCRKAMDRALGRRWVEERLILKTTLGKQDVKWVDYKELV